ncbi:M16 family metallopeptidase [Pendulispora albinea]|uniref:Insulinase family protein n=1 Tax=Pendulispora albinea TaxID=2741071 RepID=A0ABZ2LL13_9BACT
MHRSKQVKRGLRFGSAGLWAIGIALIVLATALPSCSPSLVPARQGLVMRNIELPVRQLVFPSGLRVVAERDARNPIVGLFLVVGAGSSSDPPGKEGLAHYIEHLAFRSRPFGKSSFRHLLERAGAGEWNASTSLDATVYHEVGPASELSELLRLEGARMLAPVARLAPETLAVELDVVRSELRERNETGFTGEVLGALQKAVFPAGHPYARPVIGTHASLTSIGEDDIKAFLKSHYQPGNMTLAIVGDIDLATIGGIVENALPPDLLRAQASPRRPPIPGGAPEPPPPPSVPFSQSEASVATPEIWIGWSLPRAFDADSHLAEMLAARVGSQLVRASYGVEHEDRDIIDVQTRLVRGKDASMLLCRVVLDRGAHPKKSLAYVLDHLHLVEDGLGPRFFGEVLLGSQQRVAVVDMVLEMEDLVKHGETRALTTHFTQNPLTYTRSLAKVLDLEPEPFAKFALKYVSPERARAVLFLPAPGGDRVNAVPIGAHPVGEEEPSPIRVDEERLRAIAPSPGLGEYSRFTLPNGLRVVVGRREGSPTATVGLLIQGGVGAASDPGAMRAALSLAAVSQREDNHSFPEHFGATLRRSIRPDMAQYTLEGASGNVGTMIGIVAEHARYMVVTPAHWGHLDALVAELRLAERKPEHEAVRQFQSTLLAGSPYGRWPTASDVEKARPERAVDWIAETHMPENTALVVVGEIDPMEVTKIVKAELGDWKASADDKPPSVPAPYPPKTDRGFKVLVTDRPSATQVQMHLGCVFPPAKTLSEGLQREVAAQLVEDRLGGTLRERLGVTYGIRSHARVLRGGTSFLETSSAVERDRLTTALKTVQGALWALGEAPVSQDALGWAKLRVARARTTAHVMNHGTANILLNTINQGFSVENLDFTASYIASVSAKDVHEDLHACAAGTVTLSLVGDEPTIRFALKEAGLR